MDNENEVSRFALMAFGAAVGLLVLIVLGFMSFSVITTGNVGVKRTLGKISPEETPAGLIFKYPFITSIAEVSVKEIPVPLNDLTPKAKDNLSIQDMDVTVYYRADPNMVAEIISGYANSSERDGGGVLYPAFNLVFAEARKATYSAVAEVEALSVHTQRDSLAVRIQETLQSNMENAKIPVTVTRVVIRAINTDPSVEDAIRTAIANQKRLEAKAVEVEIAEKDAQIRITEARGIAEANAIIDKSLSDAYLQHEQNLALQKFAESGDNHTIVVPANFGSANLLVDASPN